MVQLTIIYVNWLHKLKAMLSLNGFPACSRAIGPVDRMELEGL